MTRRRVAQYYKLAKPGIVYGNDLAYAAGYAAALPTVTASPANFAGSLIGISCIMASSCVVNNMADRHIDRLMTRTQHRAVAQGDISLLSAGMYAAGLLMIGSGLLWRYGTLIALMVSLAGWVLYAIVYTWTKRRTYHATLIGAVPGALPLVIGYAAAGGSINWYIGVLALAMAGWQMVHFYAIALYRRDDYRSAALPTVVQARGIRPTIRYMRWYAVIFAICASLAAWWAGWVSVVLTAIAIVWLGKACLASTLDSRAWARRVFRTSLGVLVVWSLAIASAAVQ